MGARMFVTPCDHGHAQCYDNAIIARGGLEKVHKFVTSSKKAFAESRSI